MNRSVIHVFRNVRASYWFIPSIMLAAGIGLGAFVVWLDAGPASDLFQNVSWYQKAKADGAREVLSIIAGSMITVAGVVFSITIVAISFAAGQYGPRVLSSFMSDRGNQVTLGTFVSTFAYAVVVLRTIYGGDSTFVPQIAVLTALVLALCSVAVFIYFIHHVPESIQIGTVTRRIARNLLAALESVDSRNSEDADDSLRFSFKDRFKEQSRPARLTAVHNGYVQAVDDDSIATLACKYDLLAARKANPGDFVFEGQTLLLVQPVDRLSEDIAKQLRESWTIGSKRGHDENPLLLIDELVEIAQRALSSGINDPQTASTCIDWLSAALARAASVNFGSRLVQDAEGNVRLLIDTHDFCSVLERSFTQLRPYLARDLSAAMHALRALEKVAEVTKGPKQSNILIGEVKALTELASLSQPGSSGDRLREVSRDVQQHMQSTAQARQTSQSRPD